MARIELDEVMTGLGMLGNVLSLPRQVQNQQIANEQMKTLLAGSGLPEDMIKAATPEPSMRWLSAGQPGFGGTVLGGVGDVGAILATAGGGGAGAVEGLAVVGTAGLRGHGAGRRRRCRVDPDDGRREADQGAAGGDGRPSERIEAPDGACGSARAADAPAQPHT